MNKKGFTLIELLATIVIMGLILAMVVPAIDSLQNNNKSRPYELYAKSMVAAAKAYITKEGEDLTSLGTEDWYGCVEVELSKLTSQDVDLLKPYDQVRGTGEGNNPINCSGKVRYIKIRKGQAPPANYSAYTYQLSCTQSGKTVYNFSNLSGSCTTPAKN